jgi:hypothetical protein
VSRAKAWFDKPSTLRKIEGQMAPRFGEIGKVLSLRAWRPFDSAQDMLGATNFLEVVLFKIVR